jgi:uncharacterized protein YbjT (DUF2867 family)
MQRTALIAGASGLVGRELLARLLDDPRYAAVHALVRRPLDTAHPRLVQRQVDFAQLAGQVPAVDDAYCTLGTTLRAAGSRRAFERVDVDHVIALAHAARAAGARRFIVVSAVGSHPRALSFYARAKARMEAGVSALDFDAVHILQPSLLLGARAEQRPAEALGQRLAPWISPLLRGPLRAYRPVAAAQVAERMIACAFAADRGVQRHRLGQG